MITKAFCETIKCPDRFDFHPSENAQHRGDSDFCEAQRVHMIMYPCTYITYVGGNQKIREDREDFEDFPEHIRTDLQIAAALIKVRKR